MKPSTKLNFSAIRKCAECGQLYNIGTKGSGYKYCSRHCAKLAQHKQIEKWQADNAEDVREWQSWYRSRKFQDKLEEYTELNY